MEVNEGENRVFINMDSDSIDNVPEVGSLIIVVGFIIELEVGGIVVGTFGGEKVIDGEFEICEKVVDGEFEFGEMGDRGIDEDVISESYRIDGVDESEKGERAEQ